MHHAFSADTGIQGAYEQARRIWRRLATGEAVTLYDRESRPAVELRPSDIGHLYCVCVTRDSWGPLATDLELLLAKEPQEPYPWVVNVLDLQALVEAWEYFDWGSTELAAYLRERVQLHGRLSCDDELDGAGFFIRHGSLRTLLEAAVDHVSLVPVYSDIFDMIYGHIHHGTPAPELKRTEPMIADVKASIKAGRTVFITPSGQPISHKVRRNAPCPCGSGKKFKKCCGRPTRAPLET